MENIKERHILGGLYMRVTLEWVLKQDNVQM